LAADVLVDLHHHLAVAEAADHGIAKPGFQMFGDRTRQLGIGIPREYHHSAVVGHARPPNVNANARTARAPSNVAGAAGFEPANAGIKIPCLTTWRRPIRRS